MTGHHQALTKQMSSTCRADGTKPRVLDRGWTLRPRVHSGAPANIFVRSFHDTERGSSNMTTDKRQPRGAQKKKQRQRQQWWCLLCIDDSARPMSRKERLNPAAFYSQATVPGHRHRCRHNTRGCRNRGACPELAGRQTLNQRITLR